MISQWLKSQTLTTSDAGEDVEHLHLLVLPCKPAIRLLMLPKWVEGLSLCKNQHMYAYSSFIHNCQNVKETKISFSKWMAKSAALICCCSVAQSRPTLCDPMGCSSRASLSLPISQSLPEFVVIASVMPSSRLTLWCPLLRPSVFPSFPWWLSAVALLLTRFSRVQLCATLRLQPSRLLCPWGFLVKKTSVGCHVLLQGIFPGSNLGLLHCRQSLYHWATMRYLCSGLLFMGKK